MEQLKGILNRIMANSNSTNQPSSTQTEYECKKCKDRGYLYDESTNTSVDCICAKARRYKRLYEASGISKAFEGKTFGNFETDGRPAIIATAKKAAMKYVTEYDGKSGIALLGQVGAGKTHLCIAIANNLLKKNIGVLYMQYREALTHLKQNMLDEEFYQKELSKYKMAPVLYIDDLYKGMARQGKPNESDLSIMFEIINYRYLNTKPIIISSECNINTLLEYDEAVGSRILEMCKGNIIEFAGQELNYRLRT